MAVASDLTPLKTKLFTAGCLNTTSTFVCTTEQRCRSGEKARNGHYTTLVHVQLCSTALQLASSVAQLAA